MPNTFKRWFAILGILFGLSALLLPNIRAQTITPSPSAVKIMLLGDSITQGSYRYYLAQQLSDAGFAFDYVGSRSILCCGIADGADLDVEAHGGFSTATIISGADETDYEEWQPRHFNGIQTSAQTYRPDIVVIHLGTNDANSVYPSAAQTKANIATIIETLRQANPNVKIVLSLIIPMKSTYWRANQVPIYNAKIAELASLSTSQSPVVLVNHPSFNDAMFPANDNVHPNASGYQYMANNFYSTLSQLLQGIVPANGFMPTPLPTNDPRLFPYTPCNLTQENEFHPLRPYPRSPCDGLIPKNEEPEPMVFACGKSLNVEATASFPLAVQDLASLPVFPNDIKLAAQNQPYRCNDNPAQVCYAKKIDFNIQLDLANASVPVLGNTQDPNLSDATKVNQYLAWYLAGAVQSSDQEPINPASPADTDRLVNYSGPVKKLLPFELSYGTRAEMAKGYGSGQYHNYIVGCKEGLSIDYFKRLFEDFFTSARVNLTQFPDFAITSVRSAAGLAELVINSPGLAKEFGALISSLTEYDYASAYAHLNAIGDEVPASLITDLSHLSELVGGYFGRLGAIVETVSLDGATSCSAPGADKKRLSDLPLPPDPDDSRFETFDDYWKEYINWTGRTNVPFFGPTDLAIPFYLPDVWAQLFANVPLASMEDTIGETTVSIINENQPAGAQELKLTISPNAAETDSRLYFPHLRIINALSSLLASIMRPKDHQSALDPQSSGFVSQSITQHQGINDDTVVRNTTENNSSVVPGLPAPSPAFQNFDYASYDQRCDLKDVRMNAGDNLGGYKITGDLTYYQKFQYTPSITGVIDFTRRPPGSECTRNEDCQSNVCLPENLNGEQYCAGFGQEQTELPTEARVAVFTKLPFIDTIYNNLVFAANSVLRRFLPARPPETPADQYLRKRGVTIPGATVVNYHAASNTSGLSDVEVSAGDKSGGAELYFAHLGSLFEYILGGANSENKNLQKILRPFGIQSVQGPNVNLYGSCDDVATPVASASCTNPGSALQLHRACLINSELEKIIEAAGNFAQVPPDIIAGVLSIETRNSIFDLSPAQIAQHASATDATAGYNKYLCNPNACGAMGAMQLLTGLGVTTSCGTQETYEAAKRINNWATYGPAVVEACQAPSGYAPNPGNIRDSIFAGAKMIKTISGTSSGTNWDQATVYRVAESYYGSCGPNARYNLTTILENSNACIQPNPTIPAGDMTYCEYLWNYYQARN